MITHANREITPTLGRRYQPCCAGMFKKRATFRPTGTADVPAYRNARWAALQDCATDRADRKDRCAVGGRDEATAVPISHANEYHRRSSIPTGCFSESLTPARMSQTERKRVTVAVRSKLDTCSYQN